MCVAIKASHVPHLFRRPHWQTLTSTFPPTVCWRKLRLFFAYASEIHQPLFFTHSQDGTHILGACYARPHSQAPHFCISQWVTWGREPSNMWRVDMCNCGDLPAVRKIGLASSGTNFSPQCHFCFFREASDPLRLHIHGKNKLGMEGTAFRVIKSYMLTHQGQYRGARSPLHFKIVALYAPMVRLLENKLKPSHLLKY